MNSLIILTAVFDNLEIARELGQNINERKPFKDQTWKGTKTRTRDATLSRLVFLKFHFLLLSFLTTSEDIISYIYCELTEIFVFILLITLNYLQIHRCGCGIFEFIGEDSRIS